MSNGNDPYGIRNLKEKEELEKNQAIRSEQLMEEVVIELRNIGMKLNNIESKLEKLTP